MIESGRARSVFSLSSAVLSSGLLDYSQARIGSLGVESSGVAAPRATTTLN